MGVREREIQEVWSRYHAGELSEAEAVRRIVARGRSEEKARAYLRSPGGG